MSWFCRADLDALAECRIPLRNETWNTWVLMRSTFDSPSDRDVLEGAERHTREWLEAEGMHADNFSVSLARSLADVQFAELPTVASRSECPVPMTLLGMPEKPPVFAIVRFVLRGMGESLAWPIFNPNWLAGRDCPEAAGWILDRVFEPDPAGVPPEQPDPSLRDRIDPYLPEKSDWTTFAVVAGLVVGGYILLKKVAR